MKPLDPKTAEYWLVLAFLVVITVLDSVLIGILMFQYTDHWSLFINQGTAFVYGCISIPLVFWLKRSGKVEEEPLSGTSRAPRAPWYVLMLIGVMNGTGNFCQALGQPHTRGALQALFQLMFIPVVLCCSWIFLGKRPSLVAGLASLIIIAGIAVSSSRSFGDSTSGVTTYWYSVVIYSCAQLFFAGEKVYEEVTFSRYSRLHVIVMFMWTIWTQFFLGWALYPFQAIPAFGGIDLNQLPEVIWTGMKCTVGLSSPGAPACSWVNPLLFFSYCIVDYTCYAWGLYVIQRGGATLMVLASAISTPLTQVAYALPIHLVGFREELKWTDGVALVLVVGGFIIYQVFAPEGRFSDGKVAEEAS